MADLARAQTDAAARLETMIRMLGDRQSQLQHAVNERLDSVSHRLGDSLEKTKLSTTENLQKLNERLAVIDSAQKNITELATQVTSLQSVLSNKQSRGAFGQGRMEIIVRDGLPRDCYAFQHTLTNKMRPDCVVFLPDHRPLIIDAKFPLEAITAYRDAKTDDERKAAASRLRADIGKHVADIAAKYLIPGETQELAFMFVPSESVYAELHEDFDDVVQKAFRAKVVIVSPSLLMLAIQLVRQNRKDARMQQAAGKIQTEVGKLVDDVERLYDRIIALQKHFGQANDDVRLIVTSAEKVKNRGASIAEVEFEEDGRGAEVVAAPIPRQLEAGE
jgi:DNA recombination protein RmuC